ncbi:MAG: PQQ-binding-like beta-propeller repeat protein [Saprospiraceae bacterium]|nr:PQQ-binding-like beta-propeller repeat protein [Saprospiraceae bacterium]
MNFHKTFFLVLLVCCFFACKKDKTSEPTPDPCAGVATLVAPLQRIWSTPNQYYNAYFKPIFFGNEVIFSQLGGDYENELVGLDVKTGTLNWHTKAPGKITEKNSQLQGNLLYWVDDKNNAFVSFDLNSHMVQTLWTCDSVGAVISPNFQLINGDILVVLAYPTNVANFKNIALVRVQLQTGKETELYRSNMLFTNYDDEGILGLQTTVTSEGDTLAVFARTEYDLNIGSVSRLMALNIQNKNTKLDIALPYNYKVGAGKLIVKGNQAWLKLAQNDVLDRLACFNLTNGTITWTVTTSKLNDVILIEDKLIELSNYATRALNAQTGAEIWRQGGGIYNALLAEGSIFDFEGRLFLVRNYSVMQLDLETGCVLNNQPISLLSTQDLIFGYAKSAIEKVLYLSTWQQMIAVQL